MESHVRVELPLWRWQAVKRKIRIGAKRAGEKVLRLGKLRFPAGFEAQPGILAQAEEFRRRVPRLLRLQADLLEMWVCLCEKTRQEEHRRGIHGLSERLVASSERYILPRWVFANSRGGDIYRAAYLPGARSTEELLIEGIRSRRSLAVSFEEAEKTLEELLSTFLDEKARRTVKAEQEPGSSAFVVCTAEEYSARSIFSDFDPERFLARPECWVRVFSPEEEQAIQRARDGQLAEAVGIRKALEDVWDAPLAIDLPVWLAEFLDIDNDPKIRIRGKVRRKAVRKREFGDEA